MKWVLGAVIVVVVAAAAGAFYSVDSPDRPWSGSRSYAKRTKKGDTSAAEAIAKLSNGVLGDG